ncbi:translation initiation factor 3 subunit E [Angomonas deanei]|nr:translation initiation factor 3 subunit E [Angomonas deanei]|eukprot:EPY35516.1 translation initiation factor 3 subunit E [Angomonas deanei]
MTDSCAVALDLFFDKSEEEICTYRFKLTSTEVDQLRAQGELAVDYLSTKGVTPQVMQNMMRLAFLYYDKGAYVDAAEILSFCKAVTGAGLVRDNLLWGKLLCDTASTNWASAIAVADEIRNNQNFVGRFETKNTTTTRSRAWLLHWVLFPFFKGSIQGTEHLLQYVFDNRPNDTNRTNADPKMFELYRSVVESACPHLLRYICAAVLLNRSRQHHFRHTATMTEQIYEYSDALTRLVQLIHRSALEEALDLLPEVEELLDLDYFLCDLKNDILESARSVIFQRYIAIHTVVSIPYVAGKLGVSKEEAEIWLVNLISSSRQRAKVDSVNEQLRMMPTVHPVESTMLEKLESVRH